VSCVVDANESIGYVVYILVKIPHRLFDFLYILSSKIKVTTLFDLIFGGFSLNLEFVCLCWKCIVLFLYLIVKKLEKEMVILH
jgi:hypothetical protein